MSVFHNSVLAGAAGQGGGAAGPIKSVRFNNDDSAYLNRTPSSAGNRKTWTFSCWVKRSELTTGAANSRGLLAVQDGLDDNNYFEFRFIDNKINVAGYSTIFRRTDVLYRDVSAWYHIVLAVDTTSSTADDRIKVYVNGVEVDDFGLKNNPSQNADLAINKAASHTLGSNGTAAYFDGCIADCFLIDGQQLDPTSFGAFDDNGVWQAAAYSGTFGTNGFHLFDFANESGIGNDSSGNDNDFTVNNISSTAGAGNDVLFDVPTNGTQSDTGAGGEVSGNYATWNPLFGENVSLSNGNLKAESTTSGAYAIIASTMAMTSGKWYMEYHYTANAGEFITFGISQTNRDGTEGSGVSDTAEDFGFKCWSSGFYAQNSGSNQHNYSSSIADGDVLSLAFDADAGKLWVAKNGTWMTNSSGTGDPANGSNPDFSSLTYSGGYFFMAGPYGSTTSATLEANFGQRSWAYSAPSGFKALCTTNLPDPTIADGSAYFDVKLYEGNGTGASSTQAITGFSFSPDFAWAKARSVTAASAIYDTVRGVTQRLASSKTAVYNNEGYFESFDSNGFTVKGNSNNTNADNETYVAWCWDAGANSSKTFTVKVVSDSGNKYRFDDFGTSAVTLDLEEGSTYVFDQSDSSNSGHPLRFSTTSDGTHNSGTEYTTGVTTTGTPGSAGAKTTIVVASGAPVLHYYCSAHSGMGGQANTNSTAGASNFDGGIQATVRANLTVGFSIVKWTAPTWNGSPQSVGHGLNAAPSFIITKGIENAASWYCYHKSLDASNPQDKYITLNGTGAAGTLADSWGTSAPDSTTFGDRQLGWTGGQDVIAYCFAPVAGYSAFGSYEGNANNDGPFVYTGFRPAFVLTKWADGTDQWQIHDTSRSPENVASEILMPNTNSAEANYVYSEIDILSNGFKLRNSNQNINAASTYIYAAFSENAFSLNGGLAR